ncbi:unnamed protein product [Cuscuta campestris]|uniref:Transketolase signature 1 domain-containing protein n=1 Tax=Cuscuta campestris TaxID=132261 RepID=A0A484LHG3_9ASTE|nr:unnamed protein product [Cuscuta campestris]
MEGISNEACSLARHWGLGKLITFYDDNHISIDGELNGNSGYDDIRTAIKEAKAVKDKPTLIKVTTTIGFGSPNKANTWSVHGSALGAKEVHGSALLGSMAPLSLSIHWSRHVPEGAALEAEWNAKFSKYEKKYPEEAADLKAIISGKLPAGWENLTAWNKALIMKLNWDLANKKDNLWVRWIHSRYIKDEGIWEYMPKYDACHYWRKMIKVRQEFAAMPILEEYKPEEGYTWLMGQTPKDAWCDIVWNRLSIPKHSPSEDSTRNLSRQNLNALAKVHPGFLGGSADFVSSNMTLLKSFGDFQKDTPGEHGMGAICNGIALHSPGLIPYCATFFVFTDYMRPARVIYVMTALSGGPGSFTSDLKKMGPCISRSSTSMFHFINSL